MFIKASLSSYHQSNRAEHEWRSGRTTYAAAFSSYMILSTPLTWLFVRPLAHGTKSHMLASKLHIGRSKTMQLVPVHLDLSLSWKSHCATCSPACVFLCHLTGSCEGLIWNRFHLIFRDDIRIEHVTRNRLTSAAVQKTSAGNKCEDSHIRSYKKNGGAHRTL